MEEVTKTIDIEKAIKNSDSAFLRSLPKFVIRRITKIIGQDELNLIIHNNRNKTGLPFLVDVLKEMQVKVEIVGAENVPSEGRFIIVANHPVGGMDAMSIFYVMGNFFSDLVSPANEILTFIPNLRPIMLGINVFGRNTKETARKIYELMESDSQVILFPAGEVSRRRNGITSDIVWQKSFISKAIQHKRDVIPIHISGRNSNLFYIIANLRKFLRIKMYVETLLLPREMLKQRNSTFTFTIGKPISYQIFNDERTDSEWAQEVKEIVYSLANRKQ